MKKLSYVLLLLGLSMSVMADDMPDLAALNNAIETQRQITEAQRQIVVTRNLELTGAESTEFWPLYRDYRTDVAKLNDEFIALVNRYAKNFEMLSDKQAIELMNDSFSIEADRVKLAKRYAKKFDRVLPGVKVARFMQIEARLDAVLNLKVKSSLPLAM